MTKPWGYLKLGAWSGNGVKIEVGQIVIYCGAPSKCKVKQINPTTIYLEVIEGNVAHFRNLGPSRMTAGQAASAVGHIFKAKSPNLIWVIDLNIPDGEVTGHPLEGSWVTCSKGIRFQVTGRKQLPWGFSWVGTDETGAFRASRHPKIS